MFAALLLALAAQGTSVTVLQPLEKQVIQRDDRAGADVKIVVAAPSGIGNLTAKVTPHAGKALLGTATLVKTEVLGDKSQFSATMRLPSGGWYRLGVFVDGIAGPVEMAHVDSFGVGDVFVIAGQSNSTNSGEEKIASLDERVMAFDGTRWALAADPMPGVQDATTGGSPWPACGRDLAVAYGIPIGFASCGYGGTSIAQWQKGKTMDATSKVVLYDALKQRLTKLGTVKAILWHQGETDARNGMAKDEYVRLFTTMKEALEKDIGMKPVWIAANVSYVPGEAQAKMDAIRAQKELWTKGVALRGPDTDTLLGTARAKDGIHFSKDGLLAHGGLWAGRIRELLSQQ